MECLSRLYVLFSFYNNRTVKEWNVLSTELIEQETLASFRTTHVRLPQPLIIIISLLFNWFTLARLTAPF